MLPPIFIERRLRKSGRTHGESVVMLLVRVNVGAGSISYMGSWNPGISPTQALKSSNSDMKPCNYDMSLIADVQSTLLIKAEICSPWLYVVRHSGITPY